MKIAISIAFVLSVLASLFFPQQSGASGYLTSLGQGIEVTSYMINNGISGSSNAGLTIWVSGISNPDSCGDTDKVHIKRSTTNYSEMVAAVISAIASGKKIGFYSLGCEVIPFWGGTTTYPIVSDLWVVP